MSCDQYYPYAPGWSTRCHLGAHRVSWYFIRIFYYYIIYLLYYYILLYIFSHKENDYKTTLTFFLVQSAASGGHNPQNSQVIGSLDSQGNLLPGPMYSDRLKSGVLSLSRVQPNTFKVRFLQTQVTKRRAPNTQNGTAFVLDCRQKKMSRTVDKT